MVENPGLQQMVVRSVEEQKVLPDELAQGLLQGNPSEFGRDPCLSGAVKNDLDPALEANFLQNFGERNSLDADMDQPLLHANKWTVAARSCPYLRVRRDNAAATQPACKHEADEQSSHKATMTTHGLDR
jgi:hypothetical protein